MDLRWFVGHLGFSGESGSRCSDVLIYCVEVRDGSMFCVTFSCVIFTPRQIRSQLLWVNESDLDGLAMWHAWAWRKMCLGFCWGNIKKRTMKQLESLGVYKKGNTTVVGEGSLWCRFNFLIRCRIVCLPVRCPKIENKVWSIQSHNFPGCFIWVWNLVSHTVLGTWAEGVREYGTKFVPKTDEVTGEWRRLHNEELNDLYCSSNIIQLTEARRMKWVGHVARIRVRRDYTGFWWRDLK
jgi:hypothetical protein